MSATGQLVSTVTLARFATTVDDLARESGSPWLRVVNALGSGIAVAALGTSA